MNCSTSARVFLVAALPALLPLLATSCDSAPDEGFPTCQANSMRLQGTIDGMSIDLTIPGEGGGLNQDNNGGELQSQAASMPDPTLTDLRLTWTTPINDGASGPATGTLRMVSGPFAGQAFCVGAGSTVHMPEDDASDIAQFKLTGLATGASCTEAHTGTIKGCLR